MVWTQSNQQHLCPHDEKAYKGATEEVFYTNSTNTKLCLYTCLLWYASKTFVSPYIIIYTVLNNTKQCITHYQE